MKVTAEKAEHSQVVLDIEMDPTELDKYMTIAYRHVGQRTAVPGFRKGKAPREVLERYVGRGVLLEDAIEHLIPEACDKAIDEQKLFAVAQPHIEITSVEPVKFKATVPVKPTVTLCEYKGLRVEPQPVSVTDEQVTEVVDQLRQQQAVFTPVERPVRYNDIITMTLSGCVGEEKIVDEKDVPYRVMKDFNMPLPGFPEKLEGAAKGDQREFSLIFPEDHPAEKFRGKECNFKVSVTEIKEQNLPTLDEGFIKGLNMGVDSESALREKIKTDLQRRAEALEKNRYEDAAIQKLVECAKIEYPPALLDGEVERLVRQEEEHARHNGKKLKDVLKAANKTEDQMRQDLRPIAEKRLLRSLALGQLAQEEKIAVSDEEVATEAEKMSKDAGEKAEELKKFLQLPQVRDSVENAILSRKTMEHLMVLVGGKADKNKGA